MNKQYIKTMDPEKLYKLVVTKLLMSKLTTVAETAKTTWTM